jgi:hypothetical protein
MRRLLVVLLALSVAVPSVAGAGEVDAPEPPPPRSLAQLTSLIEDYIDELTEVRSFGPLDRPARRAELIVGADLFIGTIRAEAIRYIDESVPEPVGSIISGLPRSVTVADVIVAINAAGADPVTTWIGQEAGIDLVSLRRAIGRLRSITDGLEPERVWSPGTRSSSRTVGGTTVRASGPTRAPTSTRPSGHRSKRSRRVSWSRPVGIEQEGVRSTSGQMRPATSTTTPIWTTGRSGSGPGLGSKRATSSAFSARRAMQTHPIYISYPLLLEICA